MIRIADLLATSNLSLTLVAGGAGVSRPVTWTHPSEIEDVAVWLDGGELILSTGVRFPVEGSRQVAYVESLVQARAAGIGIGHRAPPLTPELQEAADRLEFPVIRVAEDVPFGAIGRIVAAANQDAVQQRLVTEIRIFDTLRWRFETGSTAAQLFSRLESISGYRLFVVSEAGSSLLHGLEDAPQEAVELIPRLRSRPILPSGFGVPIPLAARTAYLLAVEHDDVRTAGLSAVRQIATVAAVELSSLFHQREESRRQSAETLGGLVAGRYRGAEAERYLAAAGFEAGLPLVLLAVCTPTGDPASGGALFDRFVDASVPVLMFGTPRATLVLTHHDEDAVARLAAHIDLRIGMSDPFVDTSDVARYSRQALWAVRFEAVPKARELAAYSEAESMPRWLPRDDDSLKLMVEQALSPIMEYDKRQGTQLLQTLFVYLAEERSVSRTAERLFIHSHTLRYRLDRIEGLTGRSTTRTQDVVEFWSALQALLLVNDDFMRTV